MGTPSREALEKAVEELGPFHHDVELPHGVRTVPPGTARRPVQNTRVENLVRHLWPSLLEACGGGLEGKSVLDIASCSGGFSVEASRSGASRVLGIDVVDLYLKQAEFIRDSLGLSGVEFRKMPVEDLRAADVGTFDVTFCFGLLYHLENPVLAMRRVSEVTGRVLVVDTELVPQRWSRKAIWHMNVQGPAERSGKNATTALWREKEIIQFRPTALAVERLLRFLGFPTVVHLDPKGKRLEKRYHSGERGTFLALREGGR
jgi:2-polyprenyl-3-methyl-5-hydroxy-6-metoxy-1,4-benzoquinol methylase